MRLKPFTKDILKDYFYTHDKDTFVDGKKTITILKRGARRVKNSIE